jgi:hypothetical protein
MTVQTDAAVRTARLDAISTVWGTNPKIHLYTGTQPANTATAASGTKIIEVTITPAAASGSTKDMLGGAKSGAATGAGTNVAGYYRVYNTAGSTCYEQGTVGTSGTDLIIDNTSINNGQTVNFNTFTKTEPGT